MEEQLEMVISYLLVTASCRPEFVAMRKRCFSDASGGAGPRVGLWLLFPWLTTLTRSVGFLLRQNLFAWCKDGHLLIEM